MNNEEWRPVAGYEAQYEVSSLGRVRGRDRSVACSDGRVVRLKGRILKPGPSSSGYLSVALCSAGKPRTHNIHALVAEAFIPNPHNHPLVDHEDRNKENNCVENLRWASYTINSFNTVQPPTRGVHLRKRYPHRPWVAFLSRKNIGHFRTEEEARRARTAAVSAMFKNFHR
jgi:hypothetical protein